MLNTPPPLIELRPRSNEFVDVTLPPPAKAIPRNPIHDAEIALALVKVAVPVLTATEIKEELEVPVNVGAAVKVIDALAEGAR